MNRMTLNKPARNPFGSDVAGAIQSSSVNDSWDTEVISELLQHLMIIYDNPSPLLKYYVYTLSKRESFQFLFRFHIW